MVAVAVAAIFIIVAMVAIPFLLAMCAANRQERLDEARENSERSLLSLMITRQERLEAARTDYERSLSDLKNTPADPHLREQTLAKGRVYSAMTREDKAVTVYDEVAILNDINAVCAAVAAVVAPASPKSSTTPIEARLEKLSALKLRGLITADEYESRRGALLSEI